jgi:SAM-dependent methyltransferase
MTTDIKPEFDLEYSVDDFLVSTDRDSTFLYKAIEDAMTDAGSEVAGGRVLDVACGTGAVARRIAERGCETYGIEASMEMIGVGRWVHPDSRAGMVRSLAEELPFRDGAFDRVLCQGSLDHFADGHAFMREAARITGPDGRVVIALANFESVSCRLGRLTDRAKRTLRMRRPPWRLYWETPEDHNVRGDLHYVRSLGGRELELDRIWGISMFWLFPPYAPLLNKLPERAASALWHGLDRAARGRPRHADMIISVWRKPGAAAWRTTA